MIRKIILPIMLATLWISLSEFIRNQFILKSYWTAHYQSLGLTFPSDPINGAVWGIWSLTFSIAIYIISRQFGTLQTTLLSWWVGFLMMWLVIGNMGVLPFDILAYAVPLSLLEAFVATLIIKKLS